MSRAKKTLDKVLRGSSDANIAFHDLCGMLLSLGFDLQTNGSHRIFRNPAIDGRIVIQPKNGKGKAYQVKQIRILILEFGLELGLEDDHGETA